MKKTLIYAIVMTFCLTACTKPIEKAQMTAEHFWSVVHLHRLDSISILYPDFEKLHLVKSNLHCFSSETTEVIDLGNKCFEVRTDVKIRGTKDNPINYSLFVKQNEKKEYYIYDSQGLTKLKKSDINDLRLLGYIDEGDYETQTTDQERYYLIDSVIPQKVEQVQEIIKTGIEITLIPGYYNYDYRVRNNTPFDLSGIYLYFDSDSHKNNRIYCSRLQAGTYYDNSNPEFDFTGDATNFRIAKPDAIKLCAKYKDDLSSVNQQN